MGLSVCHPPGTRTRHTLKVGYRISRTVVGDLAELLYAYAQRKRPGQVKIQIIEGTTLCAHRWIKAEEQVRTV